MKVAIINKDFEGGGAATACRRLLYALEKNASQEINLIVQYSNSIRKNLFPVHKGKYGKYRTLLNLAIEKGIFYFYEKSKEVRFAYTAGWVGDSIVSNSIIKEADIIHLHWINHGFISLHGLKSILALGKPVVWTLHDMWPYTGGCHYTNECNHYLNSCGNCPMLKHPSNKDLSYNLFQKKHNIFNTSQITFVGCSNWIVNELKKGSMLPAPSVVNIPNPIDTNLYKPLNKKESRDKFGLPQNKKIILFGAAKLTDKRKGMSFLLEAIQNLFVQRGNDFILVTFGKNPLESDLPVEVRNINYISDENSIVSLYNAADLLIVPSLEDNLPNTIMESMSCGVPVVSFRTGGIPEMISHTENGYLANLKDSADLTKGVQFILNSNSYYQLSENARNKVLQEYSEDLIANRYIELYKSLL